MNYSKQPEQARVRGREVGGVGGCGGVEDEEAMYPRRGESIKLLSFPQENHREEDEERLQELGQSSFLRPQQQLRPHNKNQQQDQQKQPKYHQQDPSQPQRQQQLPQESKRSLCNSSSTILSKLISLLDLRFDDPEVEHSYYNYYAQVKRNLLPTAIQVVLLVNTLQFLTTCLYFYLLANGLIPATKSTLIGVRDSNSNSNSNTNGNNPNQNQNQNNNNYNQGYHHNHAHYRDSQHDTLSTFEPSTIIFNWALIVPFLLQIFLLIATFMMFKVIKTELNPCRAPDKFGTSLNPVELSKFKLSLPYILWFIQLIQLASGLWPQQSFISYSTLLLYSYTIYVIFPIRLMTCIMLAFGFSFIQLILDHLLLIKLQSASATTTLATNMIETQQLFSAAQTGAESTIASSINQPIANLYSDSASASAYADNSLLIPMTSHITKLWAFLLLTLGINVIGIMSFFFYERQQRAAFLETRQSLETKKLLEEESLEQERLLLSILPKHLASEIRQDLGAVVTRQFKKIYMSRHENVSILFADIVGFTAISSKCPAAELVKTLNELFARFDKLAEKYHQLRIKILGDCYYAISGAPEERPDHAVLCVHMGLSMVEAIKSVREKTKSTVDMRVGVHTGGVLAGVLGQRQWQFDVYSKAVELANKMESSGLPGRVHISDATLRFLNDEFQVSDGDGASREEALRYANIKTYFIDKVLKPYPEGTLDANKEPRFSQDETNSQVNLEQQQQQQQQQQHLVPRNDSFNFDNQIKSFSLNFVNRQNERQFRLTADIASCISLIGLPITLLCSFLAYLNLYKNQTEVVAVYTSNFSVLLLVVMVCILPYLWKRSNSETSTTTATTITTTTTSTTLGQRQCLSASIIRIAAAVKQSAWMKLALTAFMTIIWLIAHFFAGQQTSANINSLADSKAARLFSVDLFNYFSISCSLAITAVTRISFLIKTIIILIVILLQVIMNVTILSKVLLMRLSSAVAPIISWQSQSQSQLQTPATQAPASSLAAASPSISSSQAPPLLLEPLPIPGSQQDGQTGSGSYSLNSLIDSYHFDQYIFSLTLITICWALFLINKQFELTNRRLFLWRKQVEQRKDKVADIRKKNEALVYNILPPNVAKIFLSRRIFNDEELYSKSYDSVGVLFAAMPNFSDFYTEESVNNQGLECLRVLNEVISDYDALLDREEFKNIIKIKTMGSTYMAASGLYEGDALEEAKSKISTIIQAAAKGRPSSSAASSSSLSLAAASPTPNGATATASAEDCCEPGKARDANGELEKIAEIKLKWGHLEQLTEFALALKGTLRQINKDCYNNFVLRIGINHGPITAGVIGVKKPHFDMWGNTVNVASRMESTGRADSIQVVQETRDIMSHFNFEFDKRGMVHVKGKGELMTYYLIGRATGGGNTKSNSNNKAEAK